MNPVSYTRVQYIDDKFYDLTMRKSLDDRILFVNGFGVWTCYDMFLHYQNKLKDWGVLHHVTGNLFRLFLKGDIDIKLYRYKWQFVNKLYNTAIYDMLDQI